MLLGTVAYLSPEQVERGIADARSDVYAAGLLLFEMLTGTKPFDGDTAHPVAYQHVHDDVPAPVVAGARPARRARRPGGAGAPPATPTSGPADAGDFLAEVRRPAPLTPDRARPPA